jgi:transmembrane sensor
MMADDRLEDERLQRELSLARRAAPVFGLGRQQQVIWGVRRRLQGAPAKVRRLVSVVAAACLVASAAMAFAWLRSRGDELPQRATSRDEHWELRDGSRILIETPDTQITKQRESNEEVVFELRTGAARFDVAHRPERAFRVEAGDVQVSVIGTRFRVERRGRRTLVAVERGRVRVSWSGASEELSAGEHGAYPPSEAAAAVTDRPAASAAPATASAASAPVSTASSSASTAPATAGSRQEGAVRPASSEGAPRAPSAEELFAMADGARAAGRAQEAVRALRELTQRFPHDGHAPLAAFTLGRLLLENLGQPAEAARAFAQARALAGGSSALAEDALAREAGAWRTAGHFSEAARCAKLYRALYPAGAHLKEVLRVGELSAAE